MDDELVIVGRFSTAVEAHAARLALDGEGIEAVVADDAATEILSIMGPGLGGAKVLVFSRDAERAREIIEKEREDKGPAIPAWRCHECGSDVDAGFAVCWSCEAEYNPQRSVATLPGSTEQGEDLPARTLENDDAPPTSEALCPSCGIRLDVSSSECPACSELPGDPQNPYASPRTDTDLQHVDETELAAPEVEAMVLRAWRAAVFGLVFCPVLLNLYSLWLLLRVSLSDVKLSPQSNRLFYIALAIDIVSPTMIGAGWLILYPLF